MTTKVAQGNWKCATLSTSRFWPTILTGGRGYFRVQRTRQSKTANYRENSLAEAHEDVNTLAVDYLLCSGKLMRVISLVFRQDRWCKKTGFQH